MRAIVLPSGPVYRGIDTVHVITPEIAESLKAEGYSWVSRYIPRDSRRLVKPDARGGDWLGCWTLSEMELGWILDSGLCLLPVQWGPTRGEVLTAEGGHETGRHARSAARAMGVPAGVHLFADVEGNAARRSGRNGCKEWIEAWAAAVSGGDVYKAGLYIGDPGVPLTFAQLYGLRGITSYWSAANAPVAPLPRGYAVEQDPITEVAGIQCDTDTIRADRFGDVPVLACA